MLQAEWDVVSIFTSNLLRATTACNFWSLIWPDGSAPAALASLLFDPPEPRIIGKTQCFATFLPFRGLWSSFLTFFLMTPSLLWLLLSDVFPSDSFSSLTLPSSACFICPYCRKFDFQISFGKKPPALIELHHFGILEVLAGQASGRAIISESQYRVAVCWNSGPPFHCAKGGGTLCACGAWSASDPQVAVVFLAFPKLMKHGF